MKHTKVSERKFKMLLRYFTLDHTARDAAVLTNVNVRTAERIFRLLRERTASLAVQESKEALQGEIEVDESYFGPSRVPGKRGRGAAGKTPVFGLLKRDGNVYTQIIDSCSREELLPIIKGKVKEHSTVYSDYWPAYDSLVVNGYKHYRVRHSNNEFARGNTHINGLESFWSFTKRRMAKFNGIANEKFFFFLKESEFRFNHLNENLYKILLTNLRNNPL